MVDWIPILSQGKSYFQLIFGDSEGALQTQANFIRQCPGISQVTSAVQLISGDKDGALETQKQCLKTISNVVDGIPVVGHVKGTIHYACGDRKGLNNAMKNATRTTGVMAGGALGFVVRGPVGAVAGGINGGAILDISTTLITGESSGYVAAIENARRNPNPGDIFELIVMPVADGMIGHGAGKVVQNIKLRQAAQANAPVSEPGGQALQNARRTGRVGSKVASRIKRAYRKTKGKAVKVAEVVEKPQGIIKGAVADLSRSVKIRAAAAVTVESAVPVREERTTGNPQHHNRQENQFGGNAAGNPDQHHQMQNDLEGGPPNHHTIHDNSVDSDSGFDGGDNVCICAPVVLPVVFLNIQGLYPNNREMREKMASFRNFVDPEEDSIIVLVGTGLNREHNNADILPRLGLDGYNILRQDTGVNHGHGGILLAWRRQRGRTITVTQSPLEDHQNIISFDIFCELNCDLCNDRTEKRFALAVAQKPAPAQGGVGQVQGVMGRLTTLVTRFNDPESPYDKWCILGNIFRNGQDNFPFDRVMRGVENGYRLSWNLGEIVECVLASHEFVNNEVELSQAPIGNYHASVVRLRAGRDYTDGNVCRLCM